MNDKDVSSIASQLGRLGGKKTSEKYGNEYMKKLSEKAAEARKKKLVTGKGK
jgi:hypothetical protein